MVGGSGLIAGGPLIARSIAVVELIARELISASLRDVEGPAGEGVRVFFGSCCSTMWLARCFGISFSWQKQHDTNQTSRILLVTVQLSQDF